MLAGFLLYLSGGPCADHVLIPSSARQLAVCRNPAAGDWPSRLFRYYKVDYVEAFLKKNCTS
jgi:hypothetical protein